MQKKEESPTRMHERGVDAPLEQKVNIIAQKSKERAACDLCFCFSSFFLSFFLSLSLFLSLCAHVNGKRESNKVFPLIFDTNPKHSSQKKRTFRVHHFAERDPRARLVRFKETKERFPRAESNKISRRKETREGVFSFSSEREESKRDTSFPFY